MNTGISRKFKAYLIGIFLGFYIGVPVIADDTEVFFGQAASSVRPNVLFVLDTSSSMTTVDSGETETRLDRMKSALHSILDIATNINVGLMRFSGSNSGGPVLFPVSYIDDDVCNVEDCATGGPTVSVRVSDSADDAEEDASGGMNLISDDLDMVSGPECTGTYLEIGTNINDAEEESNSNMYPNSSDLELMYDGSTQLGVGVRFTSVAIPKSATINCADMQFVVDEAGSGTVSLDIYGDDSNSAYAWDASPANRTITGRTKTSAMVNWDNVNNPSVGSTLTTPDLKGIVQEVVDRGGWSTGSDMAFMLFLDSGSASNSSNKRTVHSNNHNVGGTPPKLRVYYTTSAPVTASATQTVGLRFRDIQVPQGATITSAFVEFEVDEVASVATSLTFNGELTNDSTAFTTSTNNITGRATTTASVAWTSVPAWPTANEKKQSPDLKTIIQEITDQAGWCGGQDLSLIISGTGSRIAKSFDQTAGDAPLLTVTYDPDTIPVSGGCINTTIVKRVATSSDDAEENTTNNSVNATGSSDIEIIDDGGTQQIVGFRFQSLAIPQGATVLRSNLQFEIDEAGSGTIDVAIKGEDTDDASTFSSSSANISGRTKTTASVAWSITDNPAVDSTLTSPDVTSIVQEVVNRGAWASGNDMVFIMEKTGGTGRRTVESFSGESSGAALLTVQIQWNSGGATTTATQTVRQRLKQEVDNLEYKSGTPVVDAYYEAARYYRGESVDYGTVRGQNAATTSRSEYTRVSHPASYTGGTVTRAVGCTDDNLNATECKTETITGSPVYTSPITDSCQSSYVVLLTDGYPSSNSAASKVEAMAGLASGSCADTGNRECGPELADYLFQNDQLSSVTGTQKVITHTIGFNVNDAWLGDIANSGNGSYNTATSAAQLATVFNNILADILTTDTSFVAPAATVNQFNRLTHEDKIYFALFRPGDSPLWTGNVKKYRLYDSQLVDVNAVAAVDTSTGYFKDTAQSYWSSTADGNNAANGGAAAERSLTRNVYTNVGATPSFGSQTSLSSIAFHENTTSITESMLGAASAAERTSILQWARGVDLKDWDDDNDTSEVRMQLGDPLHSEPVIVTYGLSGGEPINVVYFGTNEGFLHALDADDGTEIFSFIPEDLLGNLKTLYDNSSADTHPYGIDGKMTVWVKNIGTSSILASEGDHVYLYFGMRRGGQSYYALNVTDKTAPKLMWQISASGDFAELGQTWSPPVHAKINIGTNGSNTEDKDVLIFAGGYDVDQDDYTTRTVDSQGRAIFIIDAQTGAKIWSGGPSSMSPDTTFSDMLYSIPSEVKVIDINSDGYADRMYVGDMGGQLWRFDIIQGEKGGSLVTGAVLANLAGSGSTADARRFYNTPDVSLSSYGGTKFLSIGIGTGYRAHPLNTAIQDSFFVIKDPDVFDPPATYATAITESNLYDASTVVSSTTVLDAINDETTPLSGWFIDMPNSGEKVLATSTTINNQIIFTTYEPNASSNTGCAVSYGTSRVYAVSILDATPKINFDTVVVDDDSNLTKEDRSVEIKIPVPPPPPKVIFTLDDPVVLIGAQTPLEDITFGDLRDNTYWYEQRD